MTQERRQTPHEGTHRDGLASLAIMLLAVALLIFAAIQIIS
ncbi:MAG: hypothetical protein O3C27_05690 [Actinomycetota bacterium]|nr:hypothetical protein [Actinomycetota bacterium]